MAKSKKPKLASVARGRPPLAKANKAALSARATRTLIRSHHNLLKARASALSANDTAKVATIDAEIAARGGLESYQLASTIGQSASRGGDSSQVLVEWLLNGVGIGRVVTKKPLVYDDATQAKRERLRMLEVGALSTENACSKVSWLDVDRIDLHSQAPGIREIDFMDLPVPALEAKKYDIVSLSLVLNFVPDAAGRGEMLRRIPQFLCRPLVTTSESVAPCLFLVLPLPCIANSRYVTEERLEEIMRSLGFSKAQVKQTSKLYYSLWNYDDQQDVRRKFAKKEIRPGGNRNNFSIVLS